MPDLHGSRTRLSPRPILKSLPPGCAARSLSSLRRERVHFPPTPDLVATYLTHSGRSYDRSAIVVSPNDCALPERNCPGRTYVLSEGNRETRLLKAVACGDLSLDEEAEEEVTSAAESEVWQRRDYFPDCGDQPSLSPDVTSSESSGFTSPPSDMAQLHRDHRSIPPTTSSISEPFHTHNVPSSPEDVHTVLNLLPHPLQPERERNRSLFPHNGRRKKEKAHSFSGSGCGFKPPKQHTTSFACDVPPDLGCLGGF